MRFFLEIAYNGKTFSGWQIQPNKRTVQGEINQALSTILQEEISCVGCGRTDTGVHASQYFLHFDCVKQPPVQLQYKLNSILDGEIAVKQVFPVQKDMHSRFNATERAYKYRVHFYKDPFKKDFSYQCFYSDLDREAMNEVVKLLPTLQDFAALSKTDEDQTNTLCDVKTATLEFRNNFQEMEFNISSNRFLYNMIRRIVGLLITVGRGKISLAEVKQTLENGGTFSINFVAPPQGLYLCRVDYPFLGE